MTPLHLDLTDYRSMKLLDEVAAGISQTAAPVTEQKS